MLWAITIKFRQRQGCQSLQHASHCDWPQFAVKLLSTQPMCTFPPSCIHVPWVLVLGLCHMIGSTRQQLHGHCWGQHGISSKICMLGLIGVAMGHFGQRKSIWEDQAAMNMNCRQHISILFDETMSLTDVTPVVHVPCNHNDCPDLQLLVGALQKRLKSAEGPR